MKNGNRYGIASGEGFSGIETRRKLGFRGQLFAWKKAGEKPEKMMFHRYIINKTTKIKRIMPADNKRFGRHCKNNSK